MENQFDLQKYLEKGVQGIVKDVLRSTLSDPKESVFMATYALASKDASKLRDKAEKNGEHIPPFLIASITSKCNLHCAGCYARTNHSCFDGENPQQLTDQQWLRIFREAKDMGIGFILLAGGEPLMRRDVIKMAGMIPEILFPIFTNGTLLDTEYLQEFQRNRNLVPVFSIEGKQDQTDTRRGSGTYEKVLSSMDKMKEHHLLFGSSVTVTKGNLKEVTSAEFLDKLQTRGCKLVFYIEYVPVTESSSELAFGDEERLILKEQVEQLRKKHPSMVFVSFPGDEKESGGCLAAGRGFFHINSQGGAEPCPFSPYSDINVKDASLREALHSKLFKGLEAQHLLLEDHPGGCVLFEQRKKVEKLLEA